MNYLKKMVTPKDIVGAPISPHYRILDSNILTNLKVQPFFYNYNCRKCLENDSPKMGFVRSGAGFSKLVLIPTALGEYYAGKSGKVIPEIHRLNYLFISQHAESQPVAISLPESVTQYLDGIAVMFGDILSLLGINQEYLNFDKNTLINIVSKKTKICELRSRHEYEAFSSNYLKSKTPNKKGRTQTKLLNGGVFVSEFIANQNWHLEKTALLSYFLSILFDELKGESNFPLLETKRNSKTLNLDSIIRDFTFIHQILLQCDLNNANCTLITNDKGLEYRANQIFISFGVRAHAEGLQMKSYLSNILDECEQEFSVKRMVWSGAEWIHPSPKFRKCHGNELVFTRKHFWALM